MNIQYVSSVIQWFYLVVYRLMGLWFIWFSGSRSLYCALLAVEPAVWVGFTTTQHWSRSWESCHSLILPFCLGPLLAFSAKRQHWGWRWFHSIHTHFPVELVLPYCLHSRVSIASTTWMNSQIWLQTASMLECFFPIIKHAILGLAAKFPGFLLLVGWRLFPST